jgi:hypothetical protein
MIHRKFKMPRTVPYLGGLKDEVRLPKRNPENTKNFYI